MKGSKLPSAKWDTRFMELAQHIAQWSKDRSTKVGCVIVGPDREIRSVGYNGFPRGVDDTVEERHQRPAKYQWTEHAERNAIYNAAKGHTHVDNCTAYVPWFPCMDCARALIQSGITEIVAFQPDFDDPKWGVEFRNAWIMLREADVIVRFVDGQPVRHIAITGQPGISGVKITTSSGAAAGVNSNAN